MTTNDAELVDVRLIGLPLGLMTDSQQHSDEIMREFSHIASPLTDAERVPDRLLALSQSVRAQFGAFAGGPMEQIAEAQARGEQSIDVTFSVPAAAADASRALLTMWNEVDDFCRNGDLLTLETPPHIVQFREWFLEQFITQLEGGEPVEWPQFTASRS